MSADSFTLVAEYSVDLSGLEAGNAAAEASILGVASAADDATAQMTTAFSGVEQAIASFDEISQMAAQNMAEGLHQPTEAVDNLATSTSEASHHMTNALNEPKAAVESLASTTETSTSEASSGFTRLIESAKSLGSSLVSSVGEAKSSLTSLGESALSVGDNFISGIGHSGSSLLSLVSNLGMAQFALQGFWQTAKGVFSALFDGNASMEQTTVAFKQLLGSSSAANAELKDLQQFAASTPFEFPELADATQKLLAFQIPLKDTRPLLTAIGDALSGLGRNDAASLDQVVNVFGQMNAAGKMQTQDLMQLTSVGINGFQLLADQMHKPVSVIRQMVTQGVIPAKDGIEMLRAGMEKTFGGGMQAQSLTFNGLMSTLSDNIGAAWRAFTGPLFEDAKGALIWVGNFVSGPQFQNFAKTLGTDVGNGINLVTEGVKQAVHWFQEWHIGTYISDAQLLGKHLAQDVGDVLNHLGVVLRPLGDLFNETFGKLGSALGGSFSGDQLVRLFETIDEKAKEFTDFLNKNLGQINLRPLLDGLGQLSKLGFEGLVHTFHDLEPTLKQVADTLGGSFSNHLKTMTPLVGELGDWFQHKLVPAFKEAEPGFEHFGQIIIKDVIPAFARIWADGQKIIDDFLPPLVHGFEFLEPILVKVGGWLYDKIGSALEFVMPYLVRAADAVEKFAGELSTRLGPAVSTVVNWMLTQFHTFEGYWDAMWPGIQNVLEGVWKQIVGLVEIAWAVLSGVIKIGLDLLGGNWGQAWADMLDMLHGVWQGMQDYVSGALQILWGVVEAAAGGIWHALSDPLENLYNSTIKPIIDAIGGAIHDISSGNLGGLAHDLHLPGFASGGETPASGPYLVGEQGPELMSGGGHVTNHTDLVQLLRQVQGTSDGSAGGRHVVEVHSHIYFDGQEMTQVLGPRIVQEMRMATGMRY